MTEIEEFYAQREVFEEKALVVNDLKLINVYSGNNHFTRAENDDEFFVVTVAYFANTTKAS